MNELCVKGRKMAFLLINIIIAAITAVRFQIMNSGD